MAGGGSPEVPRVVDGPQEAPAEVDGEEAEEEEEEEDDRYDDGYRRRVDRLWRRRRVVRGRR